MPDLPGMFEVVEVRKENELLNRLVLDKPLKAEPGQFVMVWLPGVDEKPYGILNDEPLELCVAARGEFSKKLHAANKGDKLGIRGPYGNGFSFGDKPLLLVGGGYGAVPLLFLAKKARAKGLMVTVVLGAKSAGLLPLEKDFAGLGCEVVCCTDDGSRGLKGFSTLGLQQELGKGKGFDGIVCACGPELMMKAVAGECLKRGVECQLLLERFIKCGFGVCGQCALDGFLACKHGPVFDARMLAESKEFGAVTRDASGAKKKL